MSLVKLQDYVSRDVWVPWWVSHCGDAPSRVSLVHAAYSDPGAFTFFKVRLTVNDLVPLLGLSDVERKSASIEGLKSSFNSITCDWDDFSNVPDVLDLNLCLMLKHAIIRDPIGDPSAISRWFEEVVFFKLLKQAESRSEVKKAFRVLPVRDGSESNLAVAVNACASSENPVKLFLYIISSMRDLEKKNNYVGTSGNWVAHRESIINLLVPDSTSRVFLYSVADNLLVRGTRMGDDLVDEAYEEFLLLCEK